MEETAVRALARKCGLSLQPHRWGYIVADPVSNTCLTDSDSPLGLEDVYDWLVDYSARAAKED